MQTLLQTQLDLSEIATRMLAELFGHALGSIEPAFPLAFGEYGLALSLVYVILLIGGASLFGLVHNQLASSAEIHKTPQPSANSAEADVTAKTNTSIPVTAVVLAALGLLAALVSYAALSYLALSALVFVARLLVGVG